MTRARSEPEGFTPEDTARYGFFLLTFFRRAESMFFHSELGALQRESWSGIHKTLEDTLKLVPSHEWWSGNAHRFNPAFCAYIETDVLGDAERAAEDGASRLTCPSTFQPTRDIV